MADLSTQIETDAQKAQSVTVDGQTIVRRSLKEQIEADEYLARKAVAANPFACLRARKGVPGGGG